MNSLQLIGGLVGIIANVLVILAILKPNSLVEQSFAAFLLWGLLDVIAAVTTYTQPGHGNYYLPAGYAFSGLGVAACLFIKKQRDWGWIETGTVTLVLVCLYIWYKSGDKSATVASSIAVIIAAIPQGVDAYKKPEKMPLKLYWIYLLAALVSFFAGKDWTVKERFYSGAVVFLTIGAIAITILRRKRKRELASAAL